MEEQYMSFDDGKNPIHVKFPVTIGKKVFNTWIEVEKYIEYMQQIHTYYGDDYYTYDDNGKYVHVLPVEDCINSMKQRLSDMQCLLNVQRNMLSDKTDQLINLTERYNEAKPIGYKECVDALLKMWMDDIITDAKYYEICNKLNDFYKNKEG